MIRILTTAAVLALLGMAYSVWPYHSAQSIFRAMQDGDVATLSRKIEWDELRASVKQIMGAEMQRSMLQQASEEPSNAMANGLAAVIGPAIIDKMVDSMVSPSGIGTFFANQEVAAADQGSRPALRKGAIKGAGLVSPSRFEIRIGRPEDPDASLLAILRLRDFDWKLTEVVALKPLGPVKGGP
jgi:hypothetical protein